MRAHIRKLLNKETLSKIAKTVPILKSNTIDLQLVLGDDDEE